MQSFFRRLSAFASGAALLPAAVVTFGATRAFAQAPYNWEMGMQAAHSPVKERIATLHDIVLVIITVITIFVAGLLVYTVWRFDRRRNPTPSRTSHNTFLEIAWTLGPVLILLAIVIPSFRLVFFEDRAPDADMTIKVTGHQWYWEYTYPDNEGVDFVSTMIPSDQLKPGQLRLLDVDNQLVLPVGKKVRILTGSADVIHSFFIPSLGVQRYAIPGRTIETWVEIDQPGTYYGECNQICGTNHSFMPISIKAVTPADFDVWVKDAKKKFADAGSTVPAAASNVTAAFAIAQAQH